MKRWLWIAALALLTGTAASAQEQESQEEQQQEEAPSKPKRNLGHLSGSFETNSIYYIDDRTTGATAPKNHYGSNNYLKLDYQLGRFSAGLQVEYYPHPLKGLPQEGFEHLMEGFGWGNLAGKYVAWTDRNYSVTLGDFYEQFGSGLILRSWEDRALGFNNSIGGARATFNIKNIVQGKVIYGLPRFNMYYLSTQIGGGDLSFSLSNAIGLRDHAITLEGSVVNRRLNIPAGYSKEDYMNGTVDYILKRNVLSYSGRLGYEYNGWSAKLEYVGKGEDRYFNQKSGNAQLVEAGYTGDGFAVAAQFRRMEQMITRLYRPDSNDNRFLLPGNTMNYVPSLSLQHAYMLATLEPDQPDANGEMGGQIDAFYLFKRGSAIGGKRGLKLHANFSMNYRMDPESGKTGPFKYRDISFDIDKSWNSRLRTVLFVSLQKNMEHETTHNIFVADVTYKFTRSFSLRGELQYNYVSRDTFIINEKGDWMAALLEANFARGWSVFASDMYNHGDSKNHYYQAGASFTHSLVRVALSWGRSREGLICSGGVCRAMPAYTGANLAMTLTF